MEAELALLPQTEIRKLFASYKKARGREPAPDIEPTIEQISGISQVVRSDMPPYVDFAIWGPNGRRMLQKLTYLAWTFHPDGTWHRRELPGPPSFDHWWASFRVLRTAFLLMDLVEPETIDNYGEMVRGFSTEYGPRAWFIVYDADVKMRAEQMQRMRRRAEGEHEELEAGRKSGFDPAKPWKKVFEMAISDGEKLWWDEHLHRPAVFFLTKIKNAEEVVDDHTAQPSLAAPTEGGRQRQDRGVRLRSRSRSPPRKSTKADKRGAKKSQPCHAFNSEGGCSRKNCDYDHRCSHCGDKRHSAVACWQKHPHLKDQDKGKGGWNKKGKKGR